MLRQSVNLVPRTDSTRTDSINKKISGIETATEIRDLRSLKNFDTILTDNPYCKKIQGYYAEIPLSFYKTFVPCSHKFRDRYNNAYSGGQFDAPLLTLNEWRDNWNKGHPDSDKPDLLVNANWFNVWKSGIPNHGEKINPREQARTYITGLSISEGKLISSHNVLDQDATGLDTIVFDIKNKKASVISYNDIDNQISDDSDFYDNKNAVSGFIILKNRTTIKTPNLNNNDINRLPRTGIGYKNNGKNIIVMSIHNADKSCGVTASEFASLFAELNCTDAINLDNSGSVELIYNGLGEFGKKIVNVKTKTSDDNGTATERPKPNCLGFKNIKRSTFFANDDTDVPRRKPVNTDTKKENKPKTDDDFTYKYYIKR